MKISDIFFRRVERNRIAIENYYFERFVCCFVERNFSNAFFRTLTRSLDFENPIMDKLIPWQLTRFNAVDFSQSSQREIFVSTFQSTRASLAETQNNCSFMKLSLLDDKEQNCDFEKQTRTKGFLFSSFAFNWKLIFPAHSFASQ